MQDPRRPIQLARDTLESGFCLWVGAGLTKQILANKKSAPLWPELTRELEEYVGLMPGTEKDYPQSLGWCFAHLRYDGPSLFRAYLRKRLYTEVCLDLLKSAPKADGVSDLIPPRVREVASLGQLANPIVSFNVEPLSSVLLARPGGPIRLVPYSKRRSGDLTWREPFSSFHRIVYHPHGLITGDPVMTAADYEEKNATLAFGLAIHLAFGNNLAIVGMSLDDEFLQRQIEKGRDDIQEVLWFNSSFEENNRAWAAKAGVQLIEVPWAEFWHFWAQQHVAIDEKNLHAAWWLALQLALEEVEGGHLTAFAQTLQEISPENLSGCLDLARESGELGRPIEPDLDAPSIVRQIQNQIRANFDFETPLLQYSFTFRPPDLGEVKLIRV
jgi:hypothetical protein